MLIAAGAGALTHSIEIALAIGLLLAIVTFSYRRRSGPIRTAAALTSSPGEPGRRTRTDGGCGISVDYVLTVAVSLAAGVFAITSAFPGLQPYSVEIAVSLLGLVTLANLRGIRDSSTVFAIPTDL